MEQNDFDGCAGREPQHAYALGLARERYYGPEDAAYRAGRQEAQHRRKAEGWREQVTQHMLGRLW